MPAHHYQDLINLFDQTFSKTYNTHLIKGDDEPIYLPAMHKISYHQIVFAHGFYASALHEIAHWCIAGAQRRKLEDYGYWYCPDGRDATKQALFENVEIKPQALDWLFCQATRFEFHVSCDNLGGEFEIDRIGFQAKVELQAHEYLKTSIPKRAALFIKVLQEFYGTDEISIIYI